MDDEVPYVVVVFASAARVARPVSEVVVASGQPVAVVLFAGDAAGPDGGQDLPSYPLVTTRQFRLTATRNGDTSAGLSRQDHW